jgi:hypothetical protein
MNDLIGECNETVHEKAVNKLGVYQPTFLANDELK